MSVKKVSAKSVKNAIENAIENAEFIEEIKAFDITIFDKDGNEIQPDGSVQVTFSGTGVKGDATEVYHVDDAKKKAEKVSDASTDKDVAFAADHFSIYAVVGMTSTDEDVDLAKEVTMGDSFTLSADYKRNSEWTVATSSPNGVLELGKTTEEWGWGSRVSKVSITAKKQGTAIVSYGDIRIRVTVVKKQISVQFDKNGGSESAPSSINTEQGESIILPEYTGTKKDYVFAGWSTDKDATSGGSAHYTVPVYQPGDSYLAGDKNVTLYAVWASKDVNATFYIRLDNTIPTEPQGHAAASYTNGITVNGAIKTASFYANTTYPGVLDQLNSVPTDRQIAAKCSEKGITYNPETQYVHWYVIKHESAWHVDGVLLNKRDYVLSYNANCRAGEWKNMPDGASYKEGTTATVSGTVPTREGYVFTGWNTAANGSGTSYKAKDQITMNSNVTLYAQWTEKDKVTLRYVVDPAAGGSLTNAIESINPETGVPAGSAVTVNEGYEFAGWYCGTRLVSDQLVLTKEVIDQYAKNNNVYATTTFVAKLRKDINICEVDSPSDSTYDGVEHKWTPTVKDGEKVLVEGTDYTVSYNKTDYTNVTGAIEVTITGIGNYKGSVVRSYQILARKYSVKTETASKAYDGDPLTAGGEVTGLVEGETVDFKATGSQTVVGSSENTYELKWNGSAKESNYELEKREVGTLTVTESTKEVVVTTTGGTFTYDGQPHGATVSVSTLPTGYTLQTAASTATATNVADGEVTATADQLVIVNAAGEDVTAKLNITYNNGAIKITPKTATVITDSAEKVYDGTPLTAPGRIEGLVEGENVTLTMTGNQTVKGESANNYELTWDQNAVSGNYTITDSVGTLKVTEQSLDPKDPESYRNVQIDDPENKTYNGAEQKWAPTVTDAKGNVLVEDTDYTVSYDKDDFTNVTGAIKATITGIGNYKGTVEKSYQILPRELSVTTDSDEKVYDGEPLTAGGSVDGLVAGEELTLRTTGSQTEVGKSNNTYEIVWDKTAQERNYKVTGEKLGTLEVTPQSINPGPNPRIQIHLMMVSRLIAHLM